MRKILPLLSFVFFMASCVNDSDPCRQSNDNRVKISFSTTKGRVEFLDYAPGCGDYLNINGRWDEYDLRIREEEGRELPFDRVVDLARSALRVEDNDDSCNGSNRMTIEYGNTRGTVTFYDNPAGCGDFISFSGDRGKYTLRIEDEEGHEFDFKKVDEVARAYLSEDGEEYQPALELILQN